MLKHGYPLYVMNRKCMIYLLILIMLLGISLRFYHLGKESFWLDEGSTALAVKKYDVKQILSNVQEKGQILPEYYSNYNDDLPAYQIILTWWTKILGISEFSIRAFSAILGSLTLIALFYLTKYLFDSEVALLSTFLASINLTLIVYSQEARQYAYLLFFSLLSVIFLLKSLRECKTIHVVWLVIINAIIIYSHYPWLIFIAFEGVYALYAIYKDYTNKKEMHKKVIVAFLIMGVLYLPIITRGIFNRSDYVGLFGRPNMYQLAEFGVWLSTWIYPSEVMRQKIYDLSFNFSLSEWALLLSVLVTALLFGLLFLNGLIMSSYKKDPIRFMLLFFFFPLLFALILSLLHPTITIFKLKNIIYVIPPFLIFVSIGILMTKISRLLIMAIIILSILPLGAYYMNITKPQFREAAKFLPEDEPIFLNIFSSQAAFQYYYGEKDNVVGIRDVNELKPLLVDKNSFWMLLTFTKYSDPEGKIKKFLDDNYQLTDKKELFDIELLHYEKIIFLKV